MVKDRSELPNKRARNIRNYIETRYPKRNNSRRLAETAFGHLQQHLDEKTIQEDITIKDMTEIISSLKRNETSSSTIANYLGQYVPFFKYERSLELANYTNEKKKYYHKESIAENKYAPIKSTDLRRFYELAELEDKILIRLLIFEHSTDISNIPKTRLIKDENDWRLFDKDREVKIDEVTLSLIKELVQKNGSLDKNRFLNYNSVRTLNAHIEELSQTMRLQYRIDYDIYPKYLRRMGKNVHTDDLNDWLSKPKQQSSGK